jgi:ABC-type spermidine/putrescine transport system permease subunit II
MASSVASPAPGRPARWRDALAVVPVYVWLIALVLLPNVLLILTSFTKSSGGVIIYDWNIRNFASVFKSVTVQMLALRTIGVALCSALLATLIAYPLAFYVSRSLARSRTTIAMLIIIPLWISLLMRVFAWRAILGERGLLNTTLIHLGVIDTPSAMFLYTPFSVILTLTSVAIPYVFVAAYAAIERVPHSLVEAARDQGASASRAFATVIWPLTRQGTAIGIALAFLMSIGDYVTPSMVGGLNGTMLGMVIASQFGMTGNWSLGAAQAVYLLVLVALIIGLLFAVMRTRGVLTEVDSGVAPIPASWASLSFAGKIQRLVGRILFVLPFVLLYAPLAMVALFSFNDSTVQTLPLSGFTWKWYLSLPSNGPLLAALGKSLQLALISTAIGTLVGTAFALLFAGWQGRHSMIVQNLVALPLAVPGVVLGITMVMVTSLIGIPAGMGRLVLGHVAFVMPVVLFIVVSRIRRTDPSFVLAARDLGANAWDAFRTVQLPLIRGAMFGGAVLGFTLSVDEVVVSLFLTGNEPTLPVYVWNQTRFGFTPAVNAIFTCIGVLSFLLVLLAQMLINPVWSKQKSN